MGNQLERGNVTLPRACLSICLSIYYIYLSQIMPDYLLSYGRETKEALFYMYLNYIYLDFYKMLFPSTLLSLYWRYVGHKWIQSRRTWGHWWMKNWTLAGNVSFQPRRQIVSWDGQKEVSPADWRTWFSLSISLWWDLTWSSSSRCRSQHRSDMDLLEFVQRRTMNTVRGEEQLSYKDRLREFEILQPGEGTGKMLLWPFSI